MVIQKIFYVNYIFHKLYFAAQEGFEPPKNPYSKYGDFANSSTGQYLFPKSIVLIHFWEVNFATPQGSNLE